MFNYLRGAGASTPRFLIASNWHTHQQQKVELVLKNDLCEKDTVVNSIYYYISFLACHLLIGCKKGGGAEGILNRRA